MPGGLVPLFCATALTQYFKLDQAGWSGRTVPRIRNCLHGSFAPRIKSVRIWTRSKAYIVSAGAARRLDKTYKAQAERVVTVPHSRLHFEGAPPAPGPFTSPTFLKDPLISKAGVWCADAIGGGAPLAVIPSSKSERQLSASFRRSRPPGASPGADVAHLALKVRFEPSRTLARITLT